MSSFGKRGGRSGGAASERGGHGHYRGGPGRSRSAASASRKKDSGRFEEDTHEELERSVVREASWGKAPRSRAGGRPTSAMAVLGKQQAARLARNKKAAWSETDAYRGPPARGRAAQLVAEQLAGKKRAGAVAGKRAPEREEKFEEKSDDEMSAASAGAREVFGARDDDLIVWDIDMATPPPMQVYSDEMVAELDTQSTGRGADEEEEELDEATRRERDLRARQLALRALPPDDFDDDKMSVAGLPASHVVDVEGQKGGQMLVFVGVEGAEWKTAEDRNRVIERATRIVNHRLDMVELSPKELQVKMAFRRSLAKVLYLDEEKMLVVRFKAEVTKAAVGRLIARFTRHEPGVYEEDGSLRLLPGFEVSTRVLRWRPMGIARLLTAGERKEYSLYANEVVLANIERDDCTVATIKAALKDFRVGVLSVKCMPATGRALVECRTLTGKVRLLRQREMMIGDSYEVVVSLQEHGEDDFVPTEPVQCWNCFALGHTKRDRVSGCVQCCRKCGGSDHQSRACAARQRKDFYCVLCKVKGHYAEEEYCDTKVRLRNEQVAEAERARRAEQDADIAALFDMVDDGLEPVVEDVEEEEMDDSSSGRSQHSDADAHVARVDQNAVVAETSEEAYARFRAGNFAGANETFDAETGELVFEWVCDVSAELYEYRRAPATMDKMKGDEMVYFKELVARAVEKQTREEEAGTDRLSAEAKRRLVRIIEQVDEQLEVRGRGGGGGGGGQEEDAGGVSLEVMRASVSTLTTPATSRESSLTVSSVSSAQQLTHENVDRFAPKDGGYESFSPDSKRLAKDAKEAKSAARRRLSPVRMGRLSGSDGEADEPKRRGRMDEDGDASMGMGSAVGSESLPLPSESGKTDVSMGDISDVLL